MEKKERLDGGVAELQSLKYTEPQHSVGDARDSVAVKAEGQAKSGHARSSMNPALSP